MIRNYSKIKGKSMNLLKKKAIKAVNPEDAVKIEQKGVKKYQNQ